MGDTMNSKSNGAKTFGGVMAILAIMGTTIGALVSTTRPMSQRIDQLERQITAVVSSLDADNARELQDIGLFSEFRANISELSANARSTDDRMDEMDVKIQQEIKASEAMSAEKTIALDDKLQVEMFGLRELWTAANLEIKRRLEGTEYWRIDHDQRVIGINAAQWERIRAIEREVYGKPESVEHGKAQGGAS